MRPDSPVPTSAAAKPVRPGRWAALTPQTQGWLRGLPGVLPLACALAVAAVVWVARKRPAPAA